MSTTVYADITNDKKKIIVMVLGQVGDEDMRRVGAYLSMMTALGEASDPPGAILFDLSWPTVVQLAQFGQQLRQGEDLHAWVQEEITRRTQLAEALNYQPPEGMVPYAHQIEGAALIAATGRAVLVDDAGTGKTPTAILGLMEREATTWEEIAPVLVLCPNSVVDPWVDRWREWAPNVTVTKWRGTPAKRAKLVGTAQVYVASYDTAIKDADSTKPKNNALIKLAPKTLVIDECQEIKNVDAARSHAARRLAKLADNIVALSGTPITHHAGDFWPTLTCLEPKAWTAKERWTGRYCLSNPSGDYGQQIIGLNPAFEPEFRTALMGQFRRVAKEDATDLPDKVYSTRTVSLPPKWRQVYDDFEADMFAELPDGQELESFNVLTKMTHLSQLASAAADVEITTDLNKDGEEVEHVHVHLKKPSWKVDALLEVLAERGGKPVVVFAPSRQLIEMAGKACDKAGYKVGYIIGGQHTDERSKQISSFQNGELDVMCVTTKAGGVGITLTAADCAIFLQRPWSYVDASQAEDRLHRIGSEIHESIEIIDIITENTIDTRVRAVLREKAGNLAELVKDPRIARQVLGGDNVERRKAA